MRAREHSPPRRGGEYSSQTKTSEFQTESLPNRPRNLETVIAFARFSEKTNADRASVLTTARYESWKNSFQSLGSTRYGLEELRPEWLPYPCSGTGVGRRLRARDWRDVTRPGRFLRFPAHRWRGPSSVAPVITDPTRQTHAAPA